MGLQIQSIWRLYFVRVSKLITHREINKSSKASLVNSHNILANLHRFAYNIWEHILSNKEKKEKGR